MKIFDKPLDSFKLKYLNFEIKKLIPNIEEIKCYYINDPYQSSKNKTIILFETKCNDKNLFGSCESPYDNPLDSIEILKNAIIELERSFRYFENNTLPLDNHYGILDLFCRFMRNHFNNQHIFLTDTELEIPEFYQSVCSITNEFNTTSECIVKFWDLHNYFSDIILNK